MSPKWNNYPIHPGSWDSSSGSVHSLLIKHVCVLKAKVVFLCFPLGVFHELKQKQRLYWWYRDGQTLLQSEANTA